MAVSEVRAFLFGILRMLRQVGAGWLTVRQEHVLQVLFSQSALSGQRNEDVYQVADARKYYVHLYNLYVCIPSNVGRSQKQLNGIAMEFRI